MKVTLLTLADLVSQTTAVQNLNQNFSTIQTAFDNTLSRDGTTPNQMGSAIDMNSNRIINLPAPTTSTDAARWIDVTSSFAATNFILPNPTGNDGKVVTASGGTYVLTTPASSGFLLTTNNLSDLNSVTIARSNLGLTAAAVTAIGTSGATIPLLSGTNTWSGLNINSDGGQYTGTAELRLSYVVTTTLSSDSAGFRGAPVNTQDANYTLVLDDAGRMINHTTGSAFTWTIPPNSSVPFPLGTTVLLNSSGSGAITLAQGAGVSIRPNGSGTTGNQTLSQYQLKTVCQVATNVWVYT